MGEQGGEDFVEDPGGQGGGPQLLQLRRVDGGEEGADVEELPLAPGGDRVGVPGEGGAAQTHLSLAATTSRLLQGVAESGTHEASSRGLRLWR